MATRAAQQARPALISNIAPSVTTTTRSRCTTTLSALTGLLLDSPCAIIPLSFRFGLLCLGFGCFRLLLGLGFRLLGEPPRILKADVCLLGAVPADGNVHVVVDEQVKGLRFIVDVTERAEVAAAERTHIRFAPCRDVLGFQACHVATGLRRCLARCTCRLQLFL